MAERIFWVTNLAVMGVVGIIGVGALAYVAGAFPLTIIG
jgi:hypothetical protein